MTYRIQGLGLASFADLLGASDDMLARRGARRVIADCSPGYPCRVTLEDAEPGETLILINHVSHDVATPYRSAFAIYVREDARASGCYVDEVPPVFRPRMLSLRGYDAEGMLEAALLVPGEEADAAIRALFESPRIATIDAHNAAAGCFAAHVLRN